MMSIISNSWILLIAIWTGDVPAATQFYMHVVMRTQAECMQAVQRITTTVDIFADLNPDLHIKVMCREDMPMQIYKET